MNPAPLDGQTLGNYRVLEKIGQGGMGAVYLGEHVLIGRKVAIKVLLSEFSGDPDRTRRFFNEARAAAQIRHSGIVDVLDFGTHSDGSAYIVMEHLEGESLAARLKRAGALPEATARRFARQVAGALAAAHARKIVHRDLKPDNLFLVPDENVVGGERVKVLDFGVAKLLVELEGGNAVATRSGAIIGSPAYMSPEQVRGDGTIHERTDVYALGCVLFEMVCGRRPFSASNYHSVLLMHLSDPPPRPRELAPELSPELEQLILRALAKRQEDRPASMEELAATLDVLSGATPGPMPPPRASAPPPDGMLSSTLTDSVQMPAAAATAEPVSTTLGHSAAEVTEKVTGGRRWRYAAAGSVALATAVVVALLSRPWNDPVTTPAPSPGTGAAAVPDASPPPPDAAARVPDAAPASVLDAAPVPAPRGHKPRPQKPKLERGQVIDE